MKAMENMKGLKDLENFNDQNDQMENNIYKVRDKVAQVYLGFWGDKETQERLRRRINWLASQVQGEDVLDVGCGEGILAIILAREGINVTGIDINSDALSYAQNLLGNELEIVRAKVNFIHGDVLNTELNKTEFDTVILGEVIEHLLHPDLIIKRVCSYLKPGGKLLVTTPFGYFPDPDHKQTFTLTDLVALLKPFIFPAHLSVEDGYIRFSGIKVERPYNDVDWSIYNDSLLLKITELATISQQKYLRNQIEFWKASEKNLKQEYDFHKKTFTKTMEEFVKLNKQIDALKDEKKELIQKLASIEEKFEKKIQLINETKEWFELALDTVEEAQKTFYDSNVYIKQLNNKVSSIETEHNESFSKLSSLDNKIEEYNINENESLIKLQKIYNEVKLHNNKLLQEIKALEKEREDLKQKLKITENINENISSQLEKNKALLKNVEQNCNAATQSLQRLKNSISFQLGQAIVKAFKYPGKHTILLPINIFKLLYLGLIKKSNSVEPQLNKTNMDKQDSIKKTQNNFSISTFKNYNDDKIYKIKRENIVKRLQEEDIICKQHPASVKVKSKIRIACIMDEFNFEALKYECELLQLTPECWLEEMKKFNPHLVLIDSAWKGKENKWEKKIAYISSELTDIIKYCTEEEIPTIFWNKEDPVHFETFINTASMFDYVFTTDIGCISRYKEMLGYENVFLFPFACQPAIHNPIETFERKDKLCFAGAYYARYVERQKDLKTMVDALTSIKDLEIYDRNYGKKEPMYMFPQEYKKFIVGNLPYDQIRKAYNGYKYGINMNSIKDSQTMFARRVFELLASNTVTISNYSRGLKLIFGDLVISSDNEEELKTKFTALDADELYYKKFRLLGLRKVLQEHTYENRFNYLFQKVLSLKIADSNPEILVLALIKRKSDLETIFKNYCNQSYLKKNLVLITTTCDITNEYNEIIKREGVKLYNIEKAQNINISQISGKGFVATMVPEDYYGKNYLLDMVLATNYSNADAIGKKTYFFADKDAIEVKNDGFQYRYTNFLPVRSSIIKVKLIGKENLLEWIQSAVDREFENKNCLSVDEFNYCKNGTDKNCSVVDDLENVNLGISMQEVYEASEKISVIKNSSPKNFISANYLASWFKPGKYKKVTLSLIDNDFLVKSELSEGNHQYIYSSKVFNLDEFKFVEEAKFNFVASPGLEISFVILFLSNEGERLGHTIALANRNHTSEIPEGTAKIKIGLRVLGPGQCLVKQLILDHIDFSSNYLVGRSSVLLVTNNYPQYDDLYRNAFVHQRVIQYKRQNLGIDVFRFNKNYSTGFYEFEGIDIQSGYQSELKAALKSGKYKIVLVHFLDEAMWEVFEEFVEKIKIIVWLHGAEIQPWYRRKFNSQNIIEKQHAILRSNKRVKFWNKIFSKLHPNMHFVFVSQYFANEVMEDYKVTLPGSQYSVVHNCINTELFDYKEKTPDQRLKILSIRPYASRTYANDLSVKAILELSKEPFFNELTFRIIGKGKLFNSTLEPLRGFSNVIIEETFLRQEEIAELHKKHGILLCPTRMDSQGVSRDEAMSSGLVPVTNKVAAVPEFVDETCGMLVEPEDALGMAKAIKKLYYEPELFLKLSKNASQRVRNQSGYKQTIIKEIDLINKLMKG